jgi:stage IV sporulation protein FB
VNSSWRIARIAGTDVKLHSTFLLAIAFYSWQGYQEGGLPGALITAAFVLALFGCVLLHEFGHIGMARHFGVRTPDVLLLPIGGVARLERIPEEPRQELLIALAGPAVTLLIAGGLYLYFTATGQRPDFDQMRHGNGSYLSQIMSMNWYLLAFNLIPAIPMDGGRVLRSLLALRLGWPRATRVAARLGQLIAIGFAAQGIGLFGAPPSIVLVLIAAFVFFGAGMELSSAERKAMASDVPLGQVMLTTFQTLPIHTRLEAAAELVLASDQQEFPVVDNLGRVEGLLTRDHLRHGLEVQGSAGTVGEAMAADVPALAPELPFRLALERLNASGLPALPVLDAAGVLVGMLTLRQVRELLLLSRAQRA